MGAWDHLVGGVRFDPPADAAFPPASIFGAGLFHAGLPRKAFPVLGGKQYQADAGSCTAHGYSKPIESWAKRQGADFQVCRQDLYRGARWIEGNGAENFDGGAFPSKVREWLRGYGMVSEARKPYNAHDVTTWKPPAEWAKDRALLVCGFDPLPLSASAILFEVGSNGNPVAICHKVTDSIFNVGVSGTEVFVDGPTLGGHCRAVVGYDLDRLVGGEGCALIANSWKGWGVAHPLFGMDSRFDNEPDSYSWMPLSSLENPAFLQNADRLSAPPRILP